VPYIELKKKTMKKIVYTMSMAVAILFTSCSEDRGTTTEVADANEDQRVNPLHIRDYNLPGTAAYSTASMQDQTNQTGAAANQPQPSAVELVTAYYNDVDPVKSYRTQNYKFSTTQRMRGNAAEAGTTTTSDAPSESTNMAPGSTTADAQGRDAVTSGKKSTSESKTPATDKKKTRLTPEQ
jgi:PBP1b-binding outer membrane lipoprotein LpoB